MYRINDKEAAIRELQKCLRVLGYDGLTIVPSGIYDESTRAAVERFQAENGIPKSGAVDYNTHTRMYERHKENLKTKKTSEKLGLPFLKGAYNEDIREINRCIKKIMDYYGLAHRIQNSAHFSEETERCVVCLRKIFRLPHSKEVDALLLSRIEAEYMSIDEIIDNLSHDD